MKKHEAPRSIEPSHLGAGQRRVPRTPTVGTCLMTWAAGEAEGSLLDISLEGAAVSGVYGSAPKLGAIVALAIETEHDSVQVAAEVVSIGDDTLAGIAVRMKFAEDAKSNAALRDLVAESEEAFRHDQASIFRHHLY